MIVKASGRSALIAATGLVVLCLTPVHAENGAQAPAANSSPSSAGGAPVVIRKHFRHVSHHGYTHRRFHSTVAKADADKSDNQATPANVAADDSKAPRDIPPTVANANAQMLLAGMQLSAVSAIPSGTVTQPALSDYPTAAKADEGTLVASADQLNDTDRNLQEGAQPAEAAATPQPAPLPTMTMTPQSSSWDHTSLIGKIFIGFGALLTMASAARMFMA